MADDLTPEMRAIEEKRAALRKIEGQKQREQRAKQAARARAARSSETSALSGWVWATVIAALPGGLLGGLLGAALYEDGDSLFGDRWLLIGNGAAFGLFVGPCFVLLLWVLRTLVRSGTNLLLGAGVLLLIDTTTAWQRVTVGYRPPTSILSNEYIPIHETHTAWHGVSGIVMGLALIVLLASVVIQVLNVKLDFRLPIGEAWLTVALGVIVFALALVKILIEDHSAWPGYVGVVLAAVVVIGASLRAGARWAAS